jgi:hypothetical protein
MSQRAFLEVKPEASAALDRIVGNSFSHALMHQTSLTIVPLLVSYLLLERRRRQAKIKVKLETK